jgi:hypothetical protein
MKKIWMAALLAVLASVNAVAQTDYPIFRDTATLQPDSNRLSIEIDNLNYLRNYEYFGKIPLSYTLLGYQFIPQLKYQLNPYFQLKGGIFLRREFGRPGYVATIPVFTAKYQRNGLTLNLGNLEGALNHRFVEPVYNIESIIADRIEQGVQVKLEKRRFWMDWYIDWEKAIELGDPFREEFTTGFSTRTKLIDKERVQLEIPVQAMVAHKGGQIATSPQPVESLLNTAAGFSLQTQRKGFISGINTAHYYLWYRNISGTKLRLYDEGNGWLSTLTIKTAKHFDLDLRYWRGHKFFGPRGQPLYSSISEKVANYGEPDRELFFATFIYNKQLFPHVALDLRLEPYYDLKNEMMEYGYSVFLRFNKDFFVKRFKDAGDR